MSKPTTAIFPIQNGKLFTSLDCNNLQLINLDESNLSGGGGSGNDTGTTMAILKGDGNHGFADAVAGSDYATPADVAGKESQSAHDADVATLTGNVATLTSGLSANTAAITTKADSTATTASLALKADDSALQAYVTSNDTEVALKAYTSDITTALGDKADSASVSAALAGKEPTLPTTANDRYILARRNSSGTDAWFFVDPVTLGTTSQTFTNGQSFTNTNYDSATASFTNSDVGKTIVSSGVIPADTTILSITSATRVVLSAATLSTATGETFTIINRLLNNNVGTVTNVSFTNNVTNLLANTSGIVNPTSSPALTLNPATAGANTFFGNFTGFAAFPGFGSASAARASLGGTTAGQALFQLANPGAISFPQFTAINGAVTRTPVQVLGDIGGESALTFNAPLSRTLNAISIPAATSLVPGHLTANDWIAFNGKTPSARIITTSAPLKIDGLASANLTQDRTLSMAAASGNADGTSPVDGYLKGTDFITFVNKVPQSRTIAVSPAAGPLSITNLGQLSANLTISIAKATASVDGYLSSTDYGVFAAGAGKSVSVSAEQGPTITLSTTVPPITRVVLGSSGTQLTAPMTIILPLASGYTAALNNPPLEIVDITANGIQTTTFRLTIARAGSDLIDGVTSFQLPQGQRYIRFNSDVGARWTSAKYFVDSFRDPSDSAKQVRVDVSGQPSPGNYVFSPATTGNSVSVIPLAKQNRIWMNGIGTDGAALAEALSPTELTPQQQSVTGTNTSDTVITDNGSIDVIKLITSLDAMRRYVFPNAANYLPGQPVHFIDNTGSLTPTNFVRVITTASNTFNGATQLDILKPYFDATFYADPSTLSWTVSIPSSASTGGLSMAPFTPIPRVSATATLTCNAAYAQEHNTLLLNTASTALVITGATTGKTGIIHCIQDGNGSRALTLPSGSATPTNGLGLITLSTTAAAVDKLVWDFDGTNYTFDVQGLRYTTAAPPAFSTSDVDTTTAIATSGSTNQGIDNNLRYGLATKLVANGGVTNGSNYIIGKIRANIFRAGVTATPSWNVRMGIYSDASGVPGSLIGLASSPIVAAGLPTSESTNIDFDTNATVIGKRNQATVTVTQNNGVLTGPPGTFQVSDDVGCIVTVVSGTGAIPANTRINTLLGDGSTASIIAPDGSTALPTAGGVCTIGIQHVYWLVLFGDNPTFDGSSYVSWPYHTTAGNILWRSSTGSAWSNAASTRLSKYIAFRT